MANVTANICSVNGMGPSGMVIHAETAMMAIESATNAIERVRDDVLASGFTRRASLVLSTTFSHRKFSKDRTAARVYQKRRPERPVSANQISSGAWSPCSMRDSRRISMNTNTAVRTMEHPSATGASSPVISGKNVGSTSGKMNSSGIRNRI